MTNFSSLQALDALCCSVRCFLGPDQRTKFIVEDGAEDACLVSSCSELLSNLQVEHPVGLVALEACLAHQKAQGTGVTTMMAMTGVWAAEMEALRNQGVPIQAIIKYGDECLEHCQTALDSVAVSCLQISASLDANRDQRLPHGEQNPQAFGETRTPEIPSFPGRDCSIVKLAASSERCGNPKKAMVIKEEKEEDQFFDVQLQAPRPNPAILGPASLLQSQAGSAETDSPRDSVPETVQEDDDIAWYFERDTESAGSTLDQVISDFKEPFLFGGKCIDGGPVSNFPLKKSSIVSFQIPKERDSLDSGMQTQDDSDDEFDSCFTLEEGTSKKTLLENGTSNASVEKSGGFKEDKDFDSCFPAEFVTAGGATMIYPGNSSDATKCKGNISTQENITNSRNQSAIQESLQCLLLAKQERAVSRRLSSLQNNSRHFRTAETVIEQQVCEESTLSSDCQGGEAVMDMVDTEKMSHSMCGEEASGRHGFDAVEDNHQIDTGTGTGCNVDSSPSVVPCESVHESELEESVEGLAQERERLGDVQNNRRCFGTTDTLAAHCEVKNPDLTRSQNTDPDLISPPVSEGSGQQPAVAASHEHLLPDSGDSWGRVQIHSRHWQNDRKSLSLDCSSESIMNPSSDSQGMQDPDGMKEPDLEHLGLGLSHGSDLEMRLVIESFKMQKDYIGQRNGRMRWPDVNRVTVCKIAGPPTSESHLEDGLLVPVDDHQRLAIVEAAGKSLRALLVNGDATPTFRHAGYKNKVKTTAVDKCVGLSAVEEKAWLRDLAMLLQELDINLLVLKGHANEGLLHHCLSKKVLLLQDVSYKALQALEEVCNTCLLTYVGDATADDAACGIRAECWESGWVDRSRVKSGVMSRRTFARICVDGELLQTAVLCHPAPSLLPGSEARFWTCCCRLKTALNDSQYLLGAGLPEQMAIKQLQRLNRSNSISGNHGDLLVYKTTIVSAFAEGFVNYLVQVLKNMGKLADRSEAKTRIMKSLQRDKLEPVLSGSIQSGPELRILKDSVTDTEQLSSEDTNCLYRLEPDPSCSIWSDTTGDRITSDNASSNNWLEPVYDSYSTKRVAWESAWALVTKVLQIDAHIVTGLQDAGTQVSRLGAQRHGSVIL